MELFIRLVLAHMLGDFTFQSYTLATMKREGWKGLSIHSLLIVAFTLLLSLGASPWWWAITLIIGLTHLALDTSRSSLARSSPRRELAYFIGDQAAHLLLILAVVVSFEGAFPRWEFNSPQEVPLRLKFMLLGIAFISIIWVIPLMERYVLNLSSRCASPNISTKVDFLQRILGSIERLLAVILFVRVVPIAGILPFIPRIFLRGKRRCNLLRVVVSFILTLPIALLLLAISGG